MKILKMKKKKKYIKKSKGCYLGNIDKDIKRLKEKMKLASNNQEFEKAIELRDKIINLEDVAASSYYINHNSVPNPGELITITFSNKRIAVQLDSANEIIGNLPVQYNYLLTKIQQETRITGSIESSGTIPIPYITIKLR